MTSPETTPAPASQAVGLLSIAMSIEDLDRAVAWWQEMFGAELLGGTTLESGDRLSFLKVLNFRIELIEAPGRFRLPELFADPPANRLPIGGKAIVLEADDVTALTDELAAKGVTIVWRDLEIAGVSPVSAIRDSEGNLMTILPRNAQSGN